MGKKNVSRREFISTGIKATAATTVWPTLSGFNTLHASENRQKLAIVGTGSRGSNMWGKYLLEGHGKYVSIAALCDINPKRVAFAKKYIGIECPTYIADQFERMIREIKPDTVVVTTTDCYHASYIVRALEMGCNVITEKPIATDSEQCQEILNMEKQTGKKILTTFNARHGKTAEEIKKILLSGEIGKIISVDYQEYLDI